MEPEEYPAIPPMSFTVSLYLIHIGDGFCVKHAPVTVEAGKFYLDGVYVRAV